MAPLAPDDDIFREPVGDPGEGDFWRERIVPHAWDSLRGICCTAKSPAELLRVDHVLSGWGEYWTEYAEDCVGLQQVKELRRLLRPVINSVAPGSVEDADVKASLFGDSLPASPQVCCSLSVLCELQGDADARTTYGHMFTLAVEPVPGPHACGRMYPDPATGWFLVLEEDFRCALEEAARLARRSVGVVDAALGFDLRWRLTGSSQLDRFRLAEFGLRGNSAQAGFHICCAEALKAGLGRAHYSLGAHACVTAALLDAGEGLRLGHVGGIDAKVSRAYEDGLSVLVVCGMDAEDAKTSLGRKQAGIRPSCLAVRTADNVGEATTIASGLPTAISAHLDAQEEALEDVNSRAPDGGSLTNSSRFVGPDVLAVQHPGEQVPDAERPSGPGNEGYPSPSSEMRVPWAKFEEAIHASRLRLAIVGPAGSGKSFVTRHLVLKAVDRARSRLARGSIDFPLWITAAELADIPDNHGAGTVARAIAEAVCRNSRQLPYGGRNLIPWLESHLDTRETFIVIDALEDTPSGRVAVLRQRLAELGKLETARLIVTCRERAWDTAWSDQLGWSSVQTVLLAESGDEALATLVSRLSATEPARAQRLEEGVTRLLAVCPPLRSLCGLPLHATLLCRAFADRTSPSFGRLVLDVAAGVLTGGWQAASAQSRRPGEIDRLWERLCNGAWALFERRPGAVLWQRSELQDQFGGLLDWLLDTGILRQERAAKPGRLGPGSDLLWAGLVASGMAIKVESMTQEDWPGWCAKLLEYGRYPEWRLPLLLFMDLVGNPQRSELVEGFADPSQDDLFGHYLEIAVAACAYGLDISPELRSTVQTRALRLYWEQCLRFDTPVVRHLQEHLPGLALWGCRVRPWERSCLPRECSLVEFLVNKIRSPGPWTEAGLATWVLGEVLAPVRHVLRDEPSLLQMSDLLGDRSDQVVACAQSILLSHASEVITLGAVEEAVEKRAACGDGAGGRAACSILIALALYDPNRIDSGKTAFAKLFVHGEARDEVAETVCTLLNARRGTPSAGDLATAIAVADNGALLDALRERFSGGANTSASHAKLLRALCDSSSVFQERFLGVRITAPGPLLRNLLSLAGRTGSPGLPYVDWKIAIRAPGYASDEYDRTGDEGSLALQVATLFMVAEESARDLPSARDEQLAGVLAEGNQIERIRACQVVRRLAKASGVLGKDAGPVLTRWAARGNDVLKAILKAFGDSDWRVRQHADWAFVQLAERNQSLFVREFPQLIQDRLRGSDAVGLMRVEQLMEACGEGLPLEAWDQMARVFLQGIDRGREDAVNSLHAIAMLYLSPKARPSEEVLDGLLRAVVSPDERIRQAACATLAKVARRAWSHYSRILEQALPIGLLSSEHDRRQASAFLVRYELGPEILSGAEFISLLCRGLESNAILVRNEAERLVCERPLYLARFPELRQWIREALARALHTGDTTGMRRLLDVVRASSVAGRHEWLEETIDSILGVVVGCEDEAVLNLALDVLCESCSGSAEPHRARRIMGKLAGHLPFLLSHPGLRMRALNLMVVLGVPDQVLEDRFADCIRALLQRAGGSSDRQRRALILSQLGRNGMRVFGEGDSLTVRIENRGRQQ